MVVEREQAQEKTAGGIVLPDTAKETPPEGIVEAVGTGRLNETTGKREPVDVSVGDTVIYSKYAGNEVKLDEVEYLILGEKDILAVVSNGKKK